MADQHKSTDAQGDGSVFLRPGFVVAAVLVLVVVLLGVIVAVRVAGSSDSSTPSPSQTSTSASTPADSSASVCGLPGSADIGPVSAAPAAAWQYEDTTAYPTSPEFGPGQSDTSGYRYCFQHSPTGAVFATANAVAQGTSSDLAKINSWAQYFVSEGSGRQQVLNELNEPRGEGTGVRLTVVGFRVLSYTSENARVDIGVQTSSSAQTIYASAAYELTWQGGDWKLNSEAATPFDFATIPSTDGYVPWKA